MWRHITRRQVIQSLGVGSVGLAVLAACGEAQEEEPPAAEAAPAAQPAPAAAAPTAAPQAEKVSISYVSDHISGPRGSAMKWGLAEFAKFRPNILLKFIPQPADFIDSFAIQMAAGSQADVAMLGDGLLGTFAADGGYVQINDVIGKHPDWDVNNYYFCPDTYTANFDHNQAQGKLPPAVIEGPQFGAPFQGAVAGIVLNLTLGEQAGIEFPSEDWTYADEFLESAKKATDPEKDLWGTWARQDFEFQWSEMALGYGANAVRNAEDTELTIFDNGGDQGLQFGTDLIHKQNVSFPVGDSKQLAGEFGNPFAAGTVWSWLSGRVYSTGFAIPRIKDRFKWSLGPQPSGPIGRPAHEFEDQPNLITNGSARKGTVEEATDFMVFMSGPMYQTRVTIDRGHLSPYKAVLETADALAAPPEGMKWLKVYADRPDKVHRMMMIPSTDEFYKFRSDIDKAYTGDSTPAEAIEAAKNSARVILAGQHDQLNFMREYFSLPRV